MDYLQLLHMHFNGIGVQTIFTDNGAGDRKWCVEGSRLEWNKGDRSSRGSQQRSTTEDCRQARRQGHCKNTTENQIQDQKTDNQADQYSAHEMYSKHGRVA